MAASHESLDSLGSNYDYLAEIQPVFSSIEFRKMEPVCFFSKYKKLLKEDSYLDKIGSVDEEAYNRLCSFKHAVLFILNEHSRENSCICLDNFTSSDIVGNGVDALKKNLNLGNGFYDEEVMVINFLKALKGRYSIALFEKDARELLADYHQDIPSFFDSLNQFNKEKGELIDKINNGADFSLKQFWDFLKVQMI